MKQRILGILTVALALSMVFAMISCDGDGSTAQVNVTYDANGWATPGDLPKDGKVAVGKTINLPTLTDSATQKFDGWSLTGSGNGAGGAPIPDYVTVKGTDPTFYVLWSTPAGAGFTVTFDTQGGSAVPSQTVQNGGKVTVPTAPTKANNTFGGWYREAAATTEWNFATDTVTGNITLYAKWTANIAGTHTVHFESNGGTPVAAIPNVPPNTTITKPADPTKANSTFQGWFKDDGTFANAWNFATDTVTANITLYAKWEADAGYFFVTFDSQGGSHVPQSAAIASGGTVTKPADPTKGTDTFDGWYKEAAGTNAWNFTTDTVTANITLYAKWTAASIVDPSTFVERVALENGAAAIYKFVLPAGGTFGDYVGLSFDVKLEYPESAGAEGTPGRQQIQAARMFGIYRDADFITNNPDGDADLEAYVAKYESAASPTSKLHGYIAGQRTGGWTYDYAALGMTNANEFFTVEYQLNGNDIDTSTGLQATPSTNQPVHADHIDTNWATATDPGPFYFAIGISGGNGNPIVQSFKNIKLIANPNYPDVEDLYSVGSGLDKPAFAAYVTAGTFAGDVGNAWRDGGDATKAAPIYVLCDANGGVGTKTIWTFPNETVTLPVPTQDAYLFNGWFTAATGGTAVTATSFATKTIIYAQWEVDPDWTDVPAWDTLTNKFDIEITDGFPYKNDGNLTNQQGFPASSFELVDLQNAIYLVLEVTELPTGGGDFGWHSADHGWSVARNSVFTNDGPNEDHGVQYVGDTAPYKIVLQLSKALLEYDDFLAMDEDSDFQRLIFQYYGSAPAANLNDLGLTAAYLLFADNYIQATWDVIALDLPATWEGGQAAQRGWKSSDAPDGAQDDLLLADLLAARFLVLKLNTANINGLELNWGNDVTSWKKAAGFPGLNWTDGLDDTEKGNLAAAGITWDETNFVLQISLEDTFGSDYEDWKDGATTWAGINIQVNNFGTAVTQAYLVK